MLTYNGSQIQHLFNDSRLKIQPLCYDMAANVMVPPRLFTKSGADAASWIFYFNNNPLIAGSGHPVIEHALNQATLSLEKDNERLARNTIDNWPRESYQIDI